MKKIFFFAAAIVAAMTVNAEVWDFSKDTINTVAAVNAFGTVQGFTLADKTSSDQKPYVAVDYKGQSGAEATLTFDESPVEIAFSYKNSGDKTEVLKLYGSYLQICRKGVKMTISCNPGDDIIITPKSYGKACEFAVTGADKEVVAFEKDSEAAVTLKATDSEVVFDSSNPSDADKYVQACQIVSIQVGAAQGIENAEVEAKAVKFFENGQLVILKNGVKYNALGVKL